MQLAIHFTEFISYLHDSHNVIVVSIYCLFDFNITIVLAGSSKRWSSQKFFFLLVDNSAERQAEKIRLLT